MGCGSSKDVTVIETEHNNSDKEPLLSESPTNLPQNDGLQKSRDSKSDHNFDTDIKLSGEKRERNELEKITDRSDKRSKSPISDSKPKKEVNPLPNSTKHLKDEAHVDRSVEPFTDPILKHTSDSRVEKNYTDDFEDDFTEESILEEAILKQHKEWTLPDTFWDGKSKLMPDYERMKTIDQHALNAPSNLRKQSKPLVEYLIQIAKTELEKFRVIFRWITNNIRYNVDVLGSSRIGVETPEGILKSGVGVCSGYSKLYEYLCSIAGVTCIEVTGLAKGAGYFPGIEIPNKLSGVEYAHAWNMINVDGAWYQCDATWAAGTVDAGQGNYIFQYKYEEYWFISEPNAFTASHLPFNAPQTIDNVNTESQLTKKPYTTCKRWNQEPQKFPGFFINNMECVSHNSGKILSRNNQVEIALKIQHPMEIFGRLASVKNGAERDLPREYTVTFFKDDMVIVRVRLPKQGDYVITICGHPYGISEEVKSALRTQLVTYTIVETGDKSLPKFPYIYCGLSWKLKLLGFRAPIKSPFIEAKNGKAEIEIKNRHGIKPWSTSFIHGTDKNSDKLDNYIYGEFRNERRVLFHIRCPKVGSYVLQVFVKPSDDPDDDNKYEYGGSFQITCSGAPAKEGFPHGSGVWGPNATMRSFGIKTSNSSSTITTENNGEGVLHLDLPSGIKISQKLCDVDGNNSGMECLCAETQQTSNDSKTKHVNLRIRCPKVGLFRLSLFGNHDNIKSNKFIGNWMVDCKTPCDGQMFPECHDLWGPKQHFKSLGLKVQSPTLSTIYTKKGKGTLVLKCTKTDFDVNKFMHSLLMNGKTANQERQCIMAEMSYGETDVLLTYHFSLPKSGMYDFRLWGNPRTIKSNSLAGQWMLVCDGPCEKKDLFPEYHQPWGPNSNFDKLQLRLQSPKTSTIHTDGGTCKLVIESQKAFDTVHGLKEAISGRSVDKSMLTLIKKMDGKKHVLEIEFNTKPGSYAFELFANRGEGGGSYDFVGKWFIVCKE